MSKTIQLVQIDPQELLGLITENFKSLLVDFRKNLPTNVQDELLTPEQVCQMLHIDNSTLWRWAKNGKVKPYGIGNRRYYKKVEIMESLIPLNSSKLIKFINLNNVA